MDENRLAAIMGCIDDALELIHPIDVPWQQLPPEIEEVRVLLQQARMEIRFLRERMD